MNWVIDPAPPASCRSVSEASSAPAPALSMPPSGDAPQPPRRQKSRRRRRKAARPANQLPASRQADVTTQAERAANSNLAHRRATRPRSVANDRPEMRSTPVKHLHNFTPSPLTQLPIPTANQNSEPTSRRDHSEIWGFISWPKTTPNRRKRDLDDDPDDERPWTDVNRKRKNTRKSPEKMTAPSTSSHPPLPKFKVVAANTSEGYLKASRLLDANKTLNIETRANLKSEWILYPKDLKTADFLRNTKDITLMELKPEEKLSKAIVIGYPLSLPTDRLTTLANIQTAQRMTTKDKVDSRTVLCTFTGPIPGHVDLGAFGRFQTRTYYPEPLRCFNCQRYDHHKTQCKAPHRCAICSGNHNTDICIQKHKQGETTTAKCPNCGQNRHAWYKRCPARLERIQDSTPAPPTTSRNVRPPTMEKINKPGPQQPQPQPASTTRRPTIQIRPPQLSSKKQCHLQSN